MFNDSIEWVQSPFNCDIKKRRSIRHFSTLTLSLRWFSQTLAHVSTVWKNLCMLLARHHYFLGCSLGAAICNVKLTPSWKNRTCKSTKIPAAERSAWRTRRSEISMMQFPIASTPVHMARSGVSCIRYADLVPLPLYSTTADAHIGYSQVAGYISCDVGSYTRGDSNTIRYSNLKARNSLWPETSSPSSTSSCTTRERENTTYPLLTFWSMIKSTRLSETIEKTVTVIVIFILRDPNYKNIVTVMSFVSYSFLRSSYVQIIYEDLHRGFITIHLYGLF